MVNSTANNSTENNSTETKVKKPEPHPRIDNEHQQAKTSFEQNFSSFYFPLLTLVPPMYRLTHSDIMCISNNGIRMDYDKGKSSTTSCQLPYEEVLASNYSRKMCNKMLHSNNNINTHSGRKNCTNGRRKETSKAQTPISNSLTQLDRKLHSEHRAYMENLKKEREEQLLIETKAANAIQRIVRGFAVRQALYPDRYEKWAEKKEIVLTESEIWTSLLDVTSKIGIYPDKSNLLGFSLPKQFQDYSK